MKQIPLGQTGLTVSELCLGTMTWGSQNTEAQAHAQIALARERGVTFWDTAEMYPVAPVRAETVGHTEAIIGAWFAAHGGRDRVVLATKVTGPGKVPIRGGGPITPEGVRAAVEGSLRRLRTDWIDLYQLHWPNRGSYHFRQIWGYRPPSDRAAAVAHMDGVLGVLADLVAEGKLRAVGVSNESVWGMAQWRARAAAAGLPLMATVQNEYSLLCRQFDSDWAEFAAMEDVPLLAFSPLATGLLTGKYQGGAVPAGSRLSISGDLGGRVTARVFDAVAAYHAVAAKHGIDPCQMAVAFCRGRPFPCVPIIGATTVDQLAVNIGAAGLVLPQAVLDDIAVAHKAHPMPY